MAAPRRLLVNLAIAALADATAAGEVLLVITPEGVLKRQKATPLVTTVTFGPGTFSLLVPAGVTTLQIEAQAAGGGAVGNGTAAAPGSPGADGENTDLLRQATLLIRAMGGKGGMYNAPPPTRASHGGFGGIGGVSYRGGDGQYANPWNGGNAGVNLVDPLRGLGGSVTAEASSGGGGGGAGTTTTYGGGGGEYLTAGILVTPGETLTLVVGAGGAGGAGTAASPQPGHAGGSGFVIVRW